MFEKPIVIAVYVGLGLAIALWGVFGRLSIWPIGRQSRALRPGVVKKFFNFLDLMTGRHPFLLGILASLIISSRLLWWWKFRDGLPIWKVLVGTTLFSVAVAFLMREVTLPRARSSTSQRLALSARGLLIVLVIAIIALVDFSTQFMDSKQTLFLAMHHWTAYLGPAEALNAGGRIFYDFAAQYGFGPTAVIAASCGGDCATGMYWVGAAASVLFGIGIVCCIANAPIATACGWTVVLVAAAMSCIFWVAYPPLVSTPLAAPSTTGLRFLPAVALTAAMMWSDTNSWGARNWALLGNALFLIGAFWSPESLFYVSFIWGPYFCARRLAECPAEQVLGRTIRSAGFVVLLFLLTSIALAGVYYALYGVWPGLAAYFAYAIYPPGPLPIKWQGPIGFVVAALALGLGAAQKIRSENGDTPEFRRLLLAVLLAFGAMSYVLGRSHSNNFLNLIPFVLVILVFVVVSPLATFYRVTGAGMIASLIGLTVFFGWTGWAQSLETSGGLEFKPERMSQARAIDTPQSAEALRQTFGLENCDPAVAQRALAAIKQVSPDPVYIFDQAYVSLSPRVWSAFHGAGNYTFMPSAMRQMFLLNSANRYKSAGWVLIHKSVPPFWLEDYKAAYIITENIDFGTYQAFHLQPRVGK